MMGAAPGVSSRAHGPLRQAGAWILCLTLGGCALTYTDVMHQVDQDLTQRNTTAALKALDRISGGRDEALYLLNKAMVLRMAGDYADSVQVFEQAKPLMLYLEATSVSETAAALTLTENLRAYQGALYERLLLHVYQGMNYLQLGQPDNARVEVVQIDDLLKRLYPGKDAAPDGSDAFPRYFSGLVYESLGEYSDAMIAYRQAYEAYKTQGKPDEAIPRDLQVSLCRFADYLGLKDELDDYQEKFGIRSWPKVGSNGEQGQVVFLLSDGLGPEKYAQTAMLQNPVNGRFYSLSLPVLRRRLPGVSGAVVSAGDDDVRTEQVANVAADAAAQMAADRPKLIADEFARNVTRDVAAKKADDQGQGLGILVSLVGSIVDQADTRIWGTLPDNIQLARMWLTPGKYDLTVKLLGRGQGQTAKTLPDVTVQADKMTFTELQWISFH